MSFLSHRLHKGFTVLASLVDVDPFRRMPFVSWRCYAQSCKEKFNYRVKEISKLLFGFFLNLSQVKFISYTGKLLTDKDCADSFQCLLKIETEEKEDKPKSKILLKKRNKRLSTKRSSYGDAETWKETWKKHCVTCFRNFGKEHNSSELGRLIINEDNQSFLRVARYVCAN